MKAVNRIKSAITGWDYGKDTEGVRTSQGQGPFALTPSFILLPGIGT